MEIDFSTIQELRRVLDSCHRFLMLIDNGPDGDQIGASYAMGMWLRSRGKEVSWCCLSPVPRAFTFSSFGEEIISQILPPENYDVVILHDCGSLKRTNVLDVYPDFFDRSYVINFDHHPSNNLYGDLNLVDTQAAATCEITYFVLKDLGAYIDPDMATYLLMGLYYDTDCFRHANTTNHTLAIASSLVQRGGDLSLACSARTAITIPSLVAWGKLMADIHMADGICSLFLTQDHLDTLGITPDDLSNMSSLLATIPNIRFSALITDVDGEIKGSLRTNRNDVDVMKIAQQFGGGGHQKASGFLFPSADDTLRSQLFRALCRTT